MRPIAMHSDCPLIYRTADQCHGPNFGFHPHSGIATLTYPLSFVVWPGGLRSRSNCR